MRHEITSKSGETMGAYDGRDAAEAVMLMIEDAGGWARPYERTWSQGDWVWAVTSDDGETVYLW